MFPKKLIIFTFLLILAVTAAACAAPPAEVREVEVTREVEVMVEVTRVVEVTPEAIENQEPAAEPSEETATQKVVSALSNQPGRAPSFRPAAITSSSIPCRH